MWTRVLISCVIMYVTRGEGVKKFEIYTALPMAMALEQHINSAANSSYS